MSDERNCGDPNCFYGDESNCFYGEPGCCLTCEDAEEDCLCYECKCTSCAHYVPIEYSDEEEREGRCELTKKWKDYEEEAERIKVEALKIYGTEPKNLKATFSNGSITHVVYYANAQDIPTKITYFLREGYPYKTRTLLLKKIEPWRLTV
jgi:hypothetical protein